MSMKSANPSEGFSVRTVVLIVVFLLLVLVGSVGGVYIWLKGKNLGLAKQQIEAEQALAQAKLDRQRDEAAAKLTVARSQQDAALIVVRNTTNALTRMLVASREMKDDADRLKASDLGRTLAMFPDLVQQARHLFDIGFAQLPADSEIVSRLESARRIELGLVGKLGSAYTPGADLVAENHSAFAWADEAMKRVSLAQAALAGLVTEARVKVTSGNSSNLTLDEAIRRFSEAEAVARQRTIEEATAKAKAEADKLMAATLSDQIKSDAQKKAAEQERKRLEEKAQEEVAAAAAKIKADAIAEEARTMLLKQKASDPQIQTILAPFITPGYLTARGTLSYDKKPFSFRELKSAGVLEPTNAGIQAMVNLAFTSQDKVRPRWGFKQTSSKSWLHVPEDMERVKKAHALLIELAPVLVQMGQLEP
jgi:hypothetical protein